MKQKRLFYIDLIRTFSCTIILIFHFSRITDQNNIVGFPKLDLFANGDWGFIAVALFFMLSGFSLMYTYGKENLKLREFYIRRFQSIYPYYWICYILVFIYYIITTGTVGNYQNIQSNPFKILIGSLLTILGLDGYLSYTFYLIGEWFLSCIILLYFIFPLFKRWVEKGNLCLYVYTIIYFLLLVFEEYSPILIHRNLFVCGYQFLLGMYICKSKIRIENKFSIVTFGAIVCFFLEIKVGIYSSLVVTIISTILFLILMYIGKNIKNKSFINIIQYISKKSFLIFLIHHVIFNELLKYYKDLIIDPLQAILLFLLCGCVILLLSTIVEKIYHIIFYRVVEGNRRVTNETL